MGSVIRNFRVGKDRGMLYDLTRNCPYRANVEREHCVVLWAAPQPPTPSLLWRSILAPVGRHASTLLWVVLEAPWVELSPFEPSFMDAHVELIGVRDKLDEPGAVYVTSHSIR